MDYYPEETVHVKPKRYHEVPYKYTSWVDPIDVLEKVTDTVWAEWAGPRTVRGSFPFYLGGDKWGEAPFELEAKEAKKGVKKKTIMMRYHSYESYNPVRDIENLITEALLELEAME